MIVPGSGHPVMTHDTRRRRFFHLDRAMPAFHLGDYPDRCRPGASRRGLPLPTSTGAACRVLMSERRPSVRPGPGLAGLRVSVFPMRASASRLHGAPRRRPFVIGLDHQRADEAGDGRVVGNDADDIGSTLQVPVDALEGDACSRSAPGSGAGHGRAPCRARCTRYFNVLAIGLEPMAPRWLTVEAPRDREPRPASPRAAIVASGSGSGSRTRAASEDWRCPPA